MAKGHDLFPGCPGKGPRSARGLLKGLRARFKKGLGFRVSGFGRVRVSGLGFRGGCLKGLRRASEGVYKSVSLNSEP